MAEFGHLQVIVSRERFWDGKWAEGPRRSRIGLKSLGEAESAEGRPAEGRLGVFEGACRPLELPLLGRRRRMNFQFILRLRTSRGTRGGGTPPRRPRRARACESGRLTEGPEERRTRGKEPARASSSELLPGDLRSKSSSGWPKAISRRLTCPELRFDPKGWRSQSAEGRSNGPKALGRRPNGLRGENLPKRLACPAECWQISSRERQIQLRWAKMKPK